MGAVRKARTKKAMYNTDGETTLLGRQKYHKFLRRFRTNYYMNHKDFEFQLGLDYMLESSGYAPTLVYTNNARKRKGLKTIRGQKKYFIS